MEIAAGAMDAGVSVFEGSICGIGGGIRMPYGMPHYGNVSTEDLRLALRRYRAFFGRVLSV
jgi:isopropylmalate/homocitrate/citramalate synthase